MHQYYFNLLSIVISSLLTGVCGSASNRRYSAYEYDMTTPQYTPDGQLLQVQYATNACIREGSPIVSVGINSIPSRIGDGNSCEEEDDADTILIMATISSLPPSKSSTSLSKPTSQKESTKDKQVEQQQTDEDEINLLMHERNQRTQNRIIEVPISKSSTILVGLTGILSDATYLLQKVYSQLEEEQQTFGWHRLGLSPVGIREISDLQSTSSPSKRRFQSMSTQPSETVMRISRAIADECQKYTFGGGQRPFGASLMLGSVDDIHVTICETHPNGGWKSQVSNEKKNDGSIPLPQIVISGGPIKSQHQLKSLLTSRLRGVYQRPFGVTTSSPGEDNTIESQTKDDDVYQESLFLRRILQTVISSVVEEWKDRDNYMSSSHATSVTDQKQLFLPQMEVVVSSNKRGTFRLTEKDLVQLIVKK